MVSVGLYGSLDIRHALERGVLGLLGTDLFKQVWHSKLWIWAEGLGLEISVSWVHTRSIFTEYMYIHSCMHAYIHAYICTEPFGTARWTAYGLNVLLRRGSTRCTQYPIYGPEYQAARIVVLRFSLTST